jgi:hypothetical protein
VFAVVCLKNLSSLKIKGRVFLISGVTYSNQGLLIEIISQAFLIWDGPFKAWNGFYCYIKLLKIVFIQKLSPKKSSTFKILYCWILLWCVKLKSQEYGLLLWCVKLKSQEYGFPHKMTCIHISWTVKQHLSGQLFCYFVGFSSGWQAPALHLFSEGHTCLSVSRALNGSSRCLASPRALSSGSTQGFNLRTRLSAPAYHTDSWTRLVLASVADPDHFATDPDPNFSGCDFYIAPDTDADPTVGRPKAHL